MNTYKLERYEANDIIREIAEDLVGEQDYLNPATITAATVSGYTFWTEVVEVYGNAVAMNYLHEEIRNAYITNQGGIC